MIGKVISHYLVQEQIGAGGMGVVYRAHDERLERDVALKVLSPELVDDQQFLSRFRREAHILSRLNHPNIATVHDFDVVDGTSFLVMEFIKGETLDRKLTSGPLPESQIVQLGQQLLAGLEAAHSEGIIHRDLKPGNLRLAPGGLLKILDFGLARLVKDDLGASVTAMTSAGVMGTLPYMSPEQLQGEPLDPRTDVYSAGVVLYELATGRRPFANGVASRVIDGILNKSPVPPRELNPQISPGLEAVILRAMRKDARLRYPSAHEMAVALTNAASVVSPPGLEPDAATEIQISQPSREKELRPSKRAIRSTAWIAAVLLGLAALGGTLWSLRRAHPVTKNLRPTVAILGFKNQTGAPEVNWVSTSLSDMLAAELAAGDQVVPVSGEAVTRMQLSLALPNEASYALDTVKRVRSSLNCDYVVYGGFFDPGKAAGGNINLNLRLQRASDGELLATVNETGTELNLPALASAVGAALRSKLGLPGISVSQSSELRAAVPSTPEAARFYYQGLEQLRTFDLLKSRESFTQALKLDPNFSLAHAYLAEAWEGLGYDEKARQESKLAFDLSSHLGREDKTLIEARYRAISGDWDQAVNLYRSLYTLYPENPEYAYRATAVQIRAGKADDAIKTIDALRKQPQPIAGDPRLDLKEAEAAESLSDFAKENQLAAKGATGARAKGYRLLEAEALWRECAAKASLGDTTGAQAACKGSIALAQLVGDLLLVARGFTVLGRIADAQGDPAEALTQHRHALEFATRIGSRRDMAGAMLNIANVMANRGDLSGAQNTYQQALAVTTEINDKTQTITLLNNLATISQAQGKYPDALKLYQQSLQEARAVLDKDAVARAQDNLGALYVLQGNFTQGLQNVQDAIAEAVETGHKGDQAQFVYTLGLTKLAQGDLAASEASFQAGLKLAGEVGDKSSLAFGKMFLADLRLQSGQPAEVEALARSAADEFHAQGMKEEESSARDVLAAAFLDLGRTDDASAQLNLISTLSPQDPAVRLAVAITTGRLHSHGSPPVNGQKNFERIVAEAQKFGIPGLQFEARLAESEEALLRGDKKTAQSLLTALERDADRRGFRQFAVRARNLAASAAVKAG